MAWPRQICLWEMPLQFGICNQNLQQNALANWYFEKTLFWPIAFAKGCPEENKHKTEEKNMECSLIAVAAA